ncbi:MAG: hypothetical protein KYX69_11210 [Sphingomonas sp.]|uniref:hypothetical protein n=1 Tax=Sphingomonas sp. TaxID=28214 RepID=UPI00262DEF3F|nr:hypothetical protein [Sphingomonas sp.]MDK2768273.1 hypothetical protein [Sphingomonas sp.]
MRYALIALPLVALSAPVTAQNLVGPTHTGNADAGMYGIPPTPVSPFLAPQRVRTGDAPMERLVSNEVVLDRKGYRIGKIETVAADGVVIRHSRGATKVPLDSIGIDSWGVLRMNVSARQFLAKASADS